MIKDTARWGAAVLALGFAAFGAQAQNLVQNGSFETGAVAFAANGYDGSKTSGINSWAVVGNGLGVDYFHQPVPPNPALEFVASDGTRFIELNATGGSAIGNGVQQTIATVPGQTYVLSFDLSGNPAGGNVPNPKLLRVQVTGSPDHVFAYDVTGHSGVNWGWAPQSFTFVATSATTTLSFLTAMAGTTFGPAVYNVAVTALAGGMSSVPTLVEWETSALILALAGFGGVAIRRQRLGVLS